MWFWLITRTITRGRTRGKDMRMFNPSHPGKILRLALGNMDVSEAASRLKISRPTLSRILNGHSGISADMSLRLEAFIGNPSEFWLDLQKQYDVAQAVRKKRPKIEPIGYGRATATPSQGKTRRSVAQSSKKDYVAS